MSESNLSQHQACFYEAPASELIVIDCTGSLMQGAAISDWSQGGEFSSPYEVPLDNFDVSNSVFLLIDDSENN